MQSPNSQEVQDTLREFLHPSPIVACKAMGEFHKEVAITIMLQGTHPASSRHRWSSRSHQNMIDFGPMITFPQSDNQHDVHLHVSLSSLTHCTNTTVITLILSVVLPHNLQIRR